jgi:hypothetical protein
MIPWVSDARKTDELHKAFNKFATSCDDHDTPVEDLRTAVFVYLVPHTLFSSVYS